MQGTASPSFVSLSPQEAVALPGTGLSQLRLCPVLLPSLPHRHLLEKCLRNMPDLCWVLPSVFFVLWFCSGSLIVASTLLQPLLLLHASVN